MHENLGGKNMKLHYGEVFFPYLGGKYYMVKKILPLIPPHKIYVEVFGGSAKLLFRKSPSEIEVYNDVDGDLVNLFEVVRNRFSEFMEKAQWLLYSRELNEKFEDLNVADDVERAIRTWYVYKTSFNGQFGAGWSFARERNRAKEFFRVLNYTLKKVHERLQNVYIDRLDFRKCIKNWDSTETFFFMDPPYRNTVQANAYAFSDADYEDLAKICHEIQGKFMITLNADQYLESLFKDFNIKYEDVLFSSYGITRLSKRKERGCYRHMLVMNYDLEKVRKIDKQISLTEFI